MPVPDDHLATERRRRLAAERLLAQKSDELYDANRQLADHADKLSYRVIEQRQENADLQGEQKRVLADLDMATEQAGRAERRLWDSLEAIGDGFAVYDRNWCLVAANRHYMALFDGIEDITLGVPFDLVLQTLMDEGLIDIGDQRPEDWVDDMITRWEKSRIEDITLRLFNGQFLRVQDKRSSDGGVVSKVTNITDTIAREAALREARDAAEAANRAKSAFLAKMSHEIRTPMNGVVGMADLILDGPLDEESRLYAETIRSSGEALLVIINDILDFSKLEAERMEFRAEPMNLEHLFLELVRLSAASIDDKTVELTLDYPALCRTGFLADRGKLRQVFTNLIGNAIKFTQAGYVRVSVTTDRIDAEGRHIVCVTVADSGIGIPANMHDHIFEEFSQVEDQKNRRFEGTGLGLAITKALVNRMGGRLDLTSAEGVGSSFMVHLPLTPDPDTPCPAKPDVSVATVGLLGVAGDMAIYLPNRLIELGITPVLIDAGSPDWTGIEAVIVVAGPCPVAIPYTLQIITVGYTARGGSPAVDRTGAHLPWPMAGSQLRAALSGLAAPAATAPAPSVTPGPARILRLLAAEDNKTNQLVFRKMLKGLHLDLTMVENGQAAVEAFARVRPDMFFTDISMPVMDGMEAARTIRRQEAEGGLSRIPIVAMTAHAMDGDEAGIRDAGIDHYMTKPLKKASLIALLTSLCPDGISVTSPEQHPDHQEIAT